MKFVRIFGVLTTAMLLSIAASIAQLPTSGVFSCIVGSTGTACPLSGNPSYASLESNKAPFAIGAIVSVSGYHAVADGGSGEFVMLGSPGGSASVCNGYVSTPTTVTGSAGSPNLSISGSYPTGLTVGELVSGNGPSLEIQFGSEIASVTKSHGNIVAIALTLPLTGTNTSSDVNVTITGSNNGTLILDSYGGIGTSTNQCWQKTNYRGDPHEFGAYGDGTTDDTQPLQYWLGAYGNVNPTFNSASAPPNFGPWNASIPANYMVIAPLTCPDNALIQGPATQTTGPAPPVRIFAARNQAGPTFSPNVAANSAAAVLTMGNRCRLSGVAVDASGLQLSGTTNGSATITNIQPNTKQIQVGDVVTAADIPSSPLAVVSTVVDSHTVTILGEVASGSNSELISFNGPNAVTIAGSRDTIDSYSLIENGYNNVFCSANSNLQAGLQLKDSLFSASGEDNLSLGGCPNVRVIGDVVSASGNRGIQFGGTDITVANGVIEQSASTGLDLGGATKVSVDSNFFDDNGKGLNGGPAIDINNTSIASICNNHMTGNGEYSTNIAQVHFGGANDGIEFCGNAYGTETEGSDATLKPSYTYYADTAALLTNSHLYESPTPQVLGVYSTPHTAAILAPLQVPQVVPQQISGFTLSNSGAEAVQISAGTAADSSNSVLIQNTGACIVDLSTGNGEGHLDTGSIAPNTTYFILAIAQASGSNPSCIASLSQTPTFDMTTTGKYNVSVSVSALSGDGYLYDVSSVAGIRSNDELASSTFVNLKTLVGSTGTITINTMGNNESPSGPSYFVITDTTAFNQMRNGMTISDGGDYAPNCAGVTPGIAYGYIGKGTTITTFPGTPNKIELSQAPTGTAANDCLTVSGGNVISLAGGSTAIATGSCSQCQNVYTGVYRMVGAVTTGSSSGSAPPVVSFTQNGDTFYLATPAYTSVALGTEGHFSVTFPSLPRGISVRAFGRCVGGGGHVLIYSPGQTGMPGNAHAFPAVPGFAVDTLTPNTTFPFSAWTDTSQSLQAITDVTGNIQCMLDGWELVRSQ